MTPGAGVPAERRDLLTDAYAAYNAQDVEALLARVTDDVDWPDGERRLHGKEELRRYWTEQWTRTRTHDQVEDVFALDDGRAAVQVSQVVRTLGGSVVSRGRFLHLHRFRDGQIARLDIRSGAPRPGRD